MAFNSEALYQELKSNTNIISGEEWRQVVTTVSRIAAEMVSKTLGPYGSTTVIDDGSGFTYPSKDGWAGLSRLHFTDPMYNTILAMLKKISFNSASTVGDGTTTAMVVTNNFLTEFERIHSDYITNNKKFNQHAFLTAMKSTAEELENRLKNNPNIRHIDLETEDGLDAIYQIANIASNGNDDISKIIYQIYKETKNPNIHVSMDGEDKTTFEIQTGYKFDSKVLDFHAYMNAENAVINFKDRPRRVVLFDHNVTFQGHEKIIGSLSKLAERDGMEIVIMAPYFDDILTGAINGAIQNMIKSGRIPTIMLVQIPITMDIHRKTISDLCVLTNAQLFTDAKVRVFNIMVHNATAPEENRIEDAVLSIKEYQFTNPEEILTSCMGTIRSIMLKKTEGFIQDYETIMNKQKYHATVVEAEETYKYHSAKANKKIGGSLDKDYLFSQMRYIKLKGTTGVINVGGVSEIQQRCDKDSIDDAVLACRSAYTHGYVRGMNLEILRILSGMVKEMGSSEKSNKYIEYAHHMLYSAFLYTSKQVIENMGCDWTDDTAEVLGLTPQNGHMFNCKTFKDLLEHCINTPSLLDFDIRNFTFSEPVRWTVVNSAQTDVEILKAVVNTLSTIISSSQFLSMTRRFDPKTTSERGLQHRLEEEYTVYENRGTAMATGFKKVIPQLTVSSLIADNILATVPEPGTTGSPYTYV